RGGAVGQHHLLPPLGRPATRPGGGPPGADPWRAPAAHRPDRDGLAAALLRDRPRPGPIPHRSRAGGHARRRWAACHPPLDGARDVGGGGGDRRRARLNPRPRQSVDSGWVFAHRWPAPGAQQAGPAPPTRGYLALMKITIYGWRISS